MSNNIKLDNKNIFVCDFETTTKESKYYQENQATNIHFGYISNLDYSKKTFFKGIKELLEWITNNTNTNIVIYFHNLNFDGAFILDWLDNQGYKATNTIIMNNGKNNNLSRIYDSINTYKFFNVSRIASGKTIYNIKITNPNKGGGYNTIQFLDSFKKLVSSVGNLQKILFNEKNPIIAKCIIKIIERHNLLKHIKIKELDTINLNNVSDCILLSYHIITNEINFKYKEYQQEHIKALIPQKDINKVSNWYQRINQPNITNVDKYNIVCNYLQEKNNKITLTKDNLLINLQCFIIPNILKNTKHLINEDTYHNTPFYETLEPYFKEHKLYMDYCKMDCITIIECLKNFNEGMYNLNYGDLEKDLKELGNLKYNLCNKTTIASVSYNLLLETIPQNLGVSKKDLEISQEERVISDCFTNGGMTIFNNAKSNKPLKGTLYYLDINSAYPFQMTNPLPYGESFKTKEQALEHSNLVCEFINVKCDYVVMKDKEGVRDIPLIKNFRNTPTTKKEPYNYLLDCKDFEGYYLREEWETLKEYFIDTQGEQLVNSYWLPLKPYFKETTLNLYNLRKEKKAKGQEGYIEKILMNSAYGKTSMRTHFKKLLFLNGGDLYPTNEKDIMENKPLNELEYITYEPINKDNTKTFKFKVEKHINPNKEEKLSYLENNPQIVATPIESSYIANKWVGNYICAKTHIKLLKAIIYFEPQNFIYSDTDSIFLMNIDKTKLKGEYMDKETLGNWKLEEELENVIFYVVRAKTYFILNEFWEPITLKIAGFNKKKLEEQLTFSNDFIIDKPITIKKASKKLSRVKGGVVLEDIDKIIIPQKPITKKYNKKDKGENENEKTK